MRHNTDVAACTYDKCEQRLNCLRWWLGTNKDPHQVYLFGEDCNGDFFVEYKE